MVRLRRYPQNTPPYYGQHCWLRRWDQDPATIRGDWLTAAQAFRVQGTTWLLPWHLVWKWKPC